METTTQTADVNPPASPTASSMRISTDALADIIDEYSVGVDQRSYEITDTGKWPAVDAEQLTRDQISALRFITFIEDHIPGYFAEYYRAFPLNQRVSTEEFIHNREMYRFTVCWAREEERHAHLLFKYQVHAGLSSAHELRDQLAREGAKPFHLDRCEEIAAIVAYTLIQEKATQHFYRLFEKNLSEPLLASILRQLGRDESRHFAFFSRLLEAYIRQFGERIVDPVKEVVAQFKMPLATTLTGYWRWAIRISDAMDYDHTEAYEHLVRTVNRVADASSHSKTTELGDLVRSLRAHA